MFEGGINLFFRCCESDIQFSVHPKSIMHCPFKKIHINITLLTLKRNVLRLAIFPWTDGVCVTLPWRCEPECGGCSSPPADSCGRRPPFSVDCRPRRPPSSSPAAAAGGADPHLPQGFYHRRAEFSSQQVWLEKENWPWHPEVIWRKRKKKHLSLRCVRPPGVSQQSAERVV